MPMRRSPANRSTRLSVSAHTRATIAPTVRQAIRINSHTAGFRAGHRQPGHCVIEAVRVPGMVARPRHRHHRRPMGG